MPDSSSKKTAPVTLKNLMDLIKNSAAVKAMKPRRVYELINTIFENSAFAERIYKILSDEKEFSDRVKNNFSKIANKIMLDLENGLTAAKMNLRRESLKQIQINDESLEQSTMEKLLSAL